MDVGSEASVVGEVPAGVVGVFVDDDLIAGPQPAVAVGVVIGRDAEVEASEPEARWTSASEMPDVAGAEARSEVAVLPGMVEVVMRIAGAGVVAYPMLLIDMGCVGVAGLVNEVAVFLRCGRCAVEGFGTVHGSGMFAACGMASALVLRRHGKSKERCDDE